MSWNIQLPWLRHNPDIRLTVTGALLLGMIITSASCGGGGGGASAAAPQAVVSVSLSPSISSLLLGNTQQFTATVSGSSNTAVTWSVNGATGGNSTVGTISSAGLYTAPGDLPNPASVTVTATSQADPTKSGNASVAVTSDITVSVQSSSSVTSIVANGSLQLTASVSSAGNPDKTIQWSVNGVLNGNSPLGTIASTGATTATYTAPAEVPTPSNVTIQATSVADPSESATLALSIVAKYVLPSTFLRRPDFVIGGQFVNAVIDRWNSGMSNYRPIDQLAAQGMDLSRGCMTTISDPDLASTPPAQWYMLGWNTSYWSSLEMMTQLFKDSMAAGMKINACYYLSDGPADAGRQNAPPTWKNLSVADTAALVEQYAYDTTTSLRNQGIQVDLYDVGNEILFGILNFRPGDRIPIPAGTDFTDLSYLRASVWPTEATLLNAAIRGIRRADSRGRIVLHIESHIESGGRMDVSYTFFETMKALGVEFDVAGLSLPYMDSTDLSNLTAQDYFQQWNDLVNRIAALGLPVYIAENSYPAAPAPGFNPPMPDFPYSDAGQAAYVHSQLLWASNNRNIIGWTWFYPEWFPGINPSAPPTLEVSGFFSDRTTLRPSAAELNANLP